MGGSDILEGQAREHLERARVIARAGWGRVHPNPVVGCVLVRAGEVVAEGYHAELGGPHAEVVALEAAGARARGATAFVTLEPCNHQGRTPPCAEALIEAGVTRVVFGVRDPGGESGGGAETLRAAGVDVEGPVWSEAVGRAENPAFFHTARQETPFVALKLAMTLDARIAEASGTRTPITGAEALAEAHRLRSGFDAILVGAGTVRVDDPELTVRLAPPGRTPPRRLVVDPSAGLASDAALLTAPGGGPVHVFVRDDAAESDLERLEGEGAHVHAVGTVAGGGLDLGEVFDVCWETGIRSILCEGGARLAASLLAEERIQRVYLFIAPFTLGRDGVPAFLNDAARIGHGHFRLAFAPERFGEDVLLVLDREERA